MENPTKLHEIAIARYGKIHGLTPSQVEKDNEFKTKWSAYRSYIRGDNDPALRRMTGQKMSAVRKELGVPSRSEMSMRERRLFLSRVQRVTPTLIRIGKGRRK